MPCCHNILFAKDMESNVMIVAPIDAMIGRVCSLISHKYLDITCVTALVSPHGSPKIMIINGKTEQT